MFYEVPCTQKGRFIIANYLINVSHVVGFIHFSNGPVTIILDAKKAGGDNRLTGNAEETMVHIKAKIRETGRAMVSVQLMDNRILHFCIEDLLAIRQLYYDNHWTDITLDSSKLADPSEFQISNEKAAELKKEIMLIQRDQEMSARKTR